jgi:hypothetical protein
MLPAVFGRENAGTGLRLTAVDILVRRPVISLAIVDQMLTADEVARMLRIARVTIIWWTTLGLRLLCQAIQGRVGRFDQISEAIGPLD